MSDPLSPAQHAALDVQEVHFALVLTEVQNPRLRDNPMWRVIRAEAMADYCRILERPDV